MDGGGKDTVKTTGSVEVGVAIAILVGAHFVFTIIHEELCLSCIVTICEEEEKVRDTEKTPALK